MANELEDFIIDDMNSDQNRENLDLGVLAAPLYVSEKTPAKQGHDRSSMHLMHMLYKSHAEKGMFNPEKFTFEHWLDSMGTEMHAPNLQGELDEAFRQDLTGKLSGDDRWKVTLGDKYQNLYGQDHQLFMESVQAGLAESKTSEGQKRAKFGQGTSMQELDRRLNMHNKWSPEVRDKLTPGKYEGE